MATQNISLMSLTVAASATIEAHRFVTAAGVQAAAGGNALGVSRTEANVGEGVAADVIGTAIVEAEAAVAVDDPIEVGADGKAKVQSGGVTVARALQAAANAGDLIEVLLIQQ